MSCATGTSPPPRTLPRNKTRWRFGLRGTLLLDLDFRYASSLPLRSNLVQSFRLLPTQSFKPRIHYERGRKRRCRIGSQRPLRLGGCVRLTLFGCRRLLSFAHNCSRCIDVARGGWCDVCGAFNPPFNLDCSVCQPLGCRFRFQWGLFHSRCKGR